MKKPKELTDWDFGDTTPRVDGFNVSYMPSATPDNFQILLDEYNNLVECFNEMAEFNGFSSFVSYEKD